MVFDVIHHFAGLGDEARRLPGIVELRQIFFCAVRTDHAHIAQRAGQTDAGEIRSAQRIRAAVLTGVARGIPFVGRVVQAVEQSLARDQAFAAVATAAAA